ncbi:37S ribosomal protein MRP17, mitochondrial [Wickerhamiella sorbophila]|uniref:37S ribosomal protein MRP17, mitochondrial n=1 Tax=Wickerhamiella sorbophila TaxID=45607 RepID=A0A2T0FCL9_9ASCO|nr:37S ribosomal protein MRP17, mitochondrial [Wickerhamiella sorbophila]PRT52710.1 37S ribosomal protein MRP17, mitochondrial [Wickerhamiella sorbophila]
MFISSCASSRAHAPSTSSYLRHILPQIFDSRGEKNLVTMLYELVGIARCASENHTKEAAEVVKHIGGLVLKNRGVIRQVENWGVRPLPRIWNQNRQSHIIAAHFYLKFDSSPSVQRQIKRALDSDARMLRSTIVRLGGKDLPSLIESDRVSA